jgi:hypothetical protein
MRQLRRTNEAAPPPSKAVNPFLQVDANPHIEDPILKIDIPTKGSGSEDISGAKYLKTLQTGAHRFPWFFEFPIATSEDIKFALKQREVSAIRRVLASVLGGRPMHAIAKRVPVSRSTVYNTLNELYFSSDLDTWTQWGLVRVWDIPAAPIIFGTLPDGYWIEKYTAPVICLLCHRVLEHVPLVDQREDFSIIEIPRENMAENNNHTEMVRGHLVAHFPMFGRPPANERRTLPWRVTGNKVPRRIAKRWIDSLEQTTVAHANQHRNQVLPLLPERQLSEVEVRKFYRGLLE